MRNSIRRAPKVKPMDKLTRRMREDAAQIRAEVSPELDARIRASLEAAEPVREETPKPAPRAASMWWWSSLVGATGALAVIVFLNIGSETPGPAPTEVVDSAIPPSLNIQRAVMTAPLEQELENLESDLRKAEEALREDLGIFAREEEDTPEGP